MANLRSGSTIENEKIITEEIIGEHRHDADSIKGLSDDLKGESEIYAERIDDVSYETMQGRFLSEYNNTMSGPLSVLANTNDPDAIISKGETDALFDASNIKDYRIYQLDPTSVPFSNRAILVSNDRGYIDPSWLGGVANYPVDISIMGSLGAMNSGDTRDFIITNYDASAVYTVTSNVGTVSMTGDVITFTAPESNPSSELINIDVSKATNTKTISIPLMADAMSNSFDNRIILNQFHDENSSFDAAKFNQSMGFVALGDHNSTSKYFALYNMDMSLLASTHIDGVELTDFEFTITDQIVAIGRDVGTGKAIVCTLDDSLNITASKSFTESVNGDTVRFSAVSVKDDGNIFISGYYQDTIDKILVLKLDNSLNVLTSAYYSDSSLDADSVSSVDAMGTSIAYDSNGNIIVGGYSYTSATNSNTGTVMKLDNDLNIINQSVYASSDSNDYETQFNDITVDSNDNILVCGYQTYNTNERGASLVVIDTNLDLVSDYNIEYLNSPSNSYDSITLESPESGIVYLSGSIKTTVTKDQVPEGYIPVYTIEDFLSIENDLDAKYALMNDLDMSQGPHHMIDGTFTGEFWGRGYVIRNFRIDDVNDNTTTASVFRQVAGGRVHHVGIEDVYFSNLNEASGSNDWVYKAGLVAALTDGGVIENCFVTGYIQGYRRMGGIVGWTHEASVIRNCWTNVELSYSSSSNVGSIVGWVSGSTVVDSYYERPNSQVGGHGTELTASTRFAQSTYQNWDFENVWDINEGVSRPYLREQAPIQVLYGEQGLEKFNYETGSRVKSVLFRGGEDSGAISEVKYFPSFGLLSSGYISYDNGNGLQKHATMLSSNSNIDFVTDPVGPINVVINPSISIRSDSLVRMAVDRTTTIVTYTITDVTFTTSTETMTSEINSTY